MDDPAAYAYYTDAIHRWVWSGFYTAEEVATMLAEQLEDDADGTSLDEATLQNVVKQEVAAKQRAEATWPAVTDCDRLAQAFAALGARGIIALHRAGYDMSDGLDEVSEAATERARAGNPLAAPLQGYCFYHGQDVERAEAGLGLWLAFGSFADHAASKALVGQQVQAALQEVGLVVEWSGDPASRLQLLPFEWKRRYAQPS